jgi:hypothetical protein
MLAPLLAPMSVIDPAAHSGHATSPCLSWYLPAPQLVHDATLDAVEYIPGTHLVHTVAPRLPPLSVIEPAEQPVHESTFDEVEYWPAAHVVHAMAPSAAPVLVNEPARHAAQ